VRRFHRAPIRSILIVLTSAALTAAGAASSKHPASPSGPSLANVLASIGELIDHIGSVRFRDLLVDAADETITFESDVTVQVSDVTTDPTQCRLSYRQRMQRDDAVTDESYQVSLRDIQSVRVELFEKYENEFTGKPGYVYIRSTPSIATVELIYPDHKANWFPFADETAAKRLAESLSEALKLCSSGAGKS
jgi:hypothetical protein